MTAPSVKLARAQMCHYDTQAINEFIERRAREASSQRVA